MFPCPESLAPLVPSRNGKPNEHWGRKVLGLPFLSEGDPRKGTLGYQTTERIPQKRVLLMRVLIADDDPFYLHWLQSHLQEWEHDVVTAVNGEEAWDQLQQPDGPRLAILDWQMPGLSGIEICQRLRASSALNSCYVILASVREDLQSTIEGLEKGADDYVPKPMDPGELRARVRTGVRVVQLQQQLQSNVADLEVALTQSQKLEAMGRLAGGVAHDFNNLLTVVSATSELLLAQRSSDAQLCEQVQMIQDASDRGAALTRQLLAFSRKQPVAPRVLNLNGLLSDLDKLLSRMIGEDIVLELVLSEKDLLIRMDPGQFEQVVINLAVNARDAMPEGGYLRIATDSVPNGSTREARLTIGDTGCGMKPETMEKIFEPFFTTKEEGKGTGLGLATVYGIVQQNAGSIHVLSQPGKGTTFEIRFPQSNEPAADQPGRETRILELGKGELVLVAEDDDAVRDIICKTLDLKRYRVLAARNGQEALELGTEHIHSIDLLLTDTVMPFLGGPELADQLLKLRANLKVLFVSGYNDDRLLRQKMQQGAFFLDKPFTLKDLAGKVREVLACS